MKVLNIIKDDLYRYTSQRDLITLFKSLVLIPGYRYTVFLRLTNPKRNIFLRFIGRIGLVITSVMYGYQIPHVTEIGRGLYIGHYGSLIINGKTSIGINCNLASGVVIGQANRGEKKGVPKIGNKVWIGANSIIVGGIEIKDNVMIAPGAYVNFNVPENSIVIGNPGKIINKSLDINVTEGYLQNCV